MSELSFDGQRQDEKVLFTFRRHLITARKGLGWLIVFSIIGVIPLIIWPGVSYMFWIFLGFVALGVLGAIYAYILWYFSIYIVTNQRLRQISQKSLFRKSVVDLSLDKIQSTSCSVPGLFAGLFGYGTILVQTSVGDLIISKVSHPEEVHNKLQNAILNTTKGKL